MRVTIRSRNWELGDYPCRSNPPVTARVQFSDIVNRSAYGKERIVLTRRGKDIVAVVPIEDLKILEAIEDRLDLEDIEKALTNPENKESISWETVKKDLGL